jgi:hypothetical protein
MGWNRKYFTPSDDSVFSFFVIFGGFEDGVNISASKYNFNEIPDNTVIQKYHDGAAPDYRDSFREGYLWDEISCENRKLAEVIKAAPSCMVVCMESSDQETLDYLRNTIGIVTHFLDNGGVCVYEPQRFKWWSPDEWRESVFLPKEPKPFEHTVILVSKQEDGNLWYHTRGLRLFARPDLSVHSVTPEISQKVHEMINRFIEFQALGGVIEDGKNINMNGLPSSMWCEHLGSVDDLDFNNKHVEIHWA